MEIRPFSIIPTNYFNTVNESKHIDTPDSLSTFYDIPSSEILEFPGVINFDIITSDDINFHFHFLS